jgi:hypothetical protein
MTSFLRVILWILHPERMDSPAFKPTESLNSMDHPSIFVLRMSKKLRSTLELRSKASMLFNSDQLVAGMVGLGGFEPPTSRLSGVRSNQTEL